MVEGGGGGVWGSLFLHSGRESILAVGREQKERDRRVIEALCGGADRGEGGRGGGRGGAINSATHAGHGGAEVLQGSWELSLS